MLRAGMLRAAARRRIPVTGGNPSHLLLHGDGTDGSTSIVDSSAYARTVTSFGASNSATQKMFGAGSLAFSGTSQYATVPDSTDWNFEGGDFTVEAFVRMTIAASGRYNVIAARDNINVTRGWLLLADSDIGGKLEFAIFSSSGVSKVLLSAAAFPTDVWKHVAVARAGNTMRMFIAGVQEASVDVTGFVAQSPASPLVLGGLWVSGAISSATQHRWPGYMDEVRITKGLARYTANFTSPAAPFTE